MGLDIVTTDADVVASMIQMFGSCNGGPNSNHINH